MIARATKVGAMPRGAQTSLRIDWATPRRLFDVLDAEFHFTLDACATAETACCRNFLDPHERPALDFTWTGVVWCNPPYGRKIGEWVTRASRSNATVVMLLPCRTDTSWWHLSVMPFAEEIRYLRGRLCFDDNRRKRAPFPSAIVIFRPRPTA